MRRKKKQVSLSLTAKYEGGFNIGSFT